MLAKYQRFHGHNGVRRVYRLGRATRTNMATLHTLRNEKVRRTKVAIVVSKKVDKSAVRRNRIRRRMYELIRSELPNITTPTEIVVTVYSVELGEMPVAQLKQLVSELFSRAKL
jgi:ribonuclease P protein component